MTHLRSHCHTKLGVFGTGCRPLFNGIAAAFAYFAWRAGTLERRLDYTQVPPAAHLYSFKDIISIVTLIGAVELFNCLMFSAWFYAGLLVLIILLGFEVYTTAREGYGEAHSLKSEAKSPFLFVLFGAVLFGGIYWMCSALSEGLGQTEMWQSLFSAMPVDFGALLISFNTLSASKVLAFVFIKAFVMLYVIEAIFLIRTSLRIGRYYVAANGSTSAEEIIDLQSKLIAALAISFGILSQWSLTLSADRLTNFLVISAAFALAAVGIDRFLLDGDRLVLGPKSR